MSNYLPDTLPFPAPRNKEEVKFWQRCRERRLEFRLCGSCGHVHHPPLPLCPKCQSVENEWCTAPQSAELYTYTIVYQAVHNDVRDSTPYVVAVVLFKELNNLRFVTNLVGVQLAEIAIGMRLSLVWEPLPNGVYLPRFKRSVEK